MFRLTMELVGNCIFTLSTANGKRNRLPSLKIGVLKGSGLAPLLLNIYTSYILTGIRLAKLRRKGVTLSVARRVIEYGYLLHSALMLTCANARRLKLRNPFVLAAQLIISSDDNSRSAAH